MNYFIKSFWYVINSTKQCDVWQQQYGFLGTILSKITVKYLHFRYITLLHPEVLFGNRLQLKTEWFYFIYFVFLWQWHRASSTSTALMYVSYCVALQKHPEKSEMKMHIYEAVARFESQLECLLVCVRACVYLVVSRRITKNHLKLYGDAFIHFVQILQMMMLLSNIMTTSNFRQSLLFFVFFLCKTEICSFPFFPNVNCAILINFVVFQFSNKFW